MKLTNQLQIIQGNILDSQDSLVAHCCNIKNTIGSGVAKALRDRFPEIYTSDTAEYIRYGKQLLGRSVIIPVITNPDDTKIKYISNLYGQPNYGYVGRHIDYEALYQSFEDLTTQCKLMNITSISMPYRIASDRAGGDWDVVKAMLISVFDNQNININLYQL